MESRKYQLQKQIIEAIEAKDNDLYSLLKSQWAHRFGVESLEELKNLDLTLLNQKTTNQDNQKIYQSEVYCLKDDKEISIKDDDNKEKEIRNDTKEVGQSVEAEKKQLLEVKSYEIVDKQNHENKNINPLRTNTSIPKVEALIPLPPKPKYGFLNKWLLRNYL